MELPSIYLNRILTQAAKKNASSLHLTVGTKPMMRIDGKLNDVSEEDMSTAELVDKIVGDITSEEDKEVLKKYKEIIFIKELASGFRFRINIFYQKKLPSITFHYIANSIKSMADLKLPKTLSNIIKLNSGLFIVAGSYNSGKTTTSAAIIEEINSTSKKNIITIEDPIEYLYVSKKSIISQRQVGQDVNSVMQGIEYCLKEDADIVYIGEIKKDFESAIPLILELASGNSLVILEINANSSVGAIEKVLNTMESKTSQEAARFSVADVLLGVIVQRLIPKVGGGLVLAAEVLLGIPSVKSLIREGKVFQLESVIQTSRREGMVGMEKVIQELASSGYINREEANGLKLDN